MILLLLIGLTLVPFVYWYHLLYKNRTLHKIPGPEPTPILGNLFPKDCYELFNEFRKLWQTYGSVFRLYTGPQINVFFASPKHMEFILGSTVHITKASSYDAVRPVIGDGLVTSGGAKWQSRRKLITPAFHFRILEQFAEVFNSTGRNLIKVLKKEVDKDIDIYPIINLYSLDIICETAMGYKINALENKDNKYVRAVDTVISTISIRTFSPWMRNETLFRLFSNLYPAYAENLKVMKDFTTNVIEKRQREYRQKKEGNTTEKEDDFGIKKKKALLDLLLSSEQASMLSTQDIQEEIDTFMFAGHDTVTSGISFALMELSRNPEIQQRLYEEITSHVGNEDRDLTISEINSMKYLDMVVKEAQRKIPSLPFAQRLISEDCYIEGIKYPKGTTVGIYIYGMHNDPELYPDPEKFDPERFTLENQAKRHNYAYVPFSAGPRNCIGQKFALNEMKLTIVKVLQNFELLPVAGYKEVLGFTGVTKSKTGIHLQLKNRN